MVRVRIQAEAAAHTQLPHIQLRALELCGARPRCLQTDGPPLGVAVVSGTNSWGVFNRLGASSVGQKNSRTFWGLLMAALASNGPVTLRPATSGKQIAAPHLRDGPQLVAASRWRGREPCNRLAGALRRNGGGLGVRGPGKTNPTAAAPIAPPRLDISTYAGQHAHVRQDNCTVARSGGARRPHHSRLLWRHALG